MMGACVPIRGVGVVVVGSWFKRVVADWGVQVLVVGFALCKWIWAEFAKFACVHGE